MYGPSNIELHDLINSLRRQIQALTDRVEELEHEADSSTDPGDADLGAALEDEYADWHTVSDAAQAVLYDPEDPSGDDEREDRRRRRARDLASGRGKC